MCIAALPKFEVKLRRKLARLNRFRYSIVAKREAIRWSRVRLK
jgi:hypothetical protein